MKAKEFKKFRLCNHVTQRELSDVTKWKLSTIRSWEQGRRDVPEHVGKVIKNLSQFLLWGE